jgi:hypothetical protein
MPTQTNEQPLPNFAKDLKELKLFHIVKTDQLEQVVVPYVGLVETEQGEMEVVVNKKTVNLQDTDFEDKEAILNTWFAEVNQRIVNRTEINTNDYSNDEDLRRKLNATIYSISHQISQLTRSGPVDTLIANYQLICFLNKGKSKIYDFRGSYFPSFDLIVNEDMGDEIILIRKNDETNNVLVPSSFIFNDQINATPVGKAGFFFVDNMDKYLHKIELKSDSLETVMEEDAIIDEDDVQEQTVEEFLDNGQETYEDASFNIESELNPFSDEEIEEDGEITKSNFKKLSENTDRIIELTKKIGNQKNKPKFVKSAEEMREIFGDTYPKYSAKPLSYLTVHDDREVIQVNSSDMTGVRDVYRLIQAHIMLRISQKHPDQMITNGKIGSIFSEFASFAQSDISVPVNFGETVYTYGFFGGVELKIDAAMRWSDNRLIFKRNNETVYTINISDENDILV